MDLVKIGFIVTANGLKEANAEVDKLLSRVDKIGSSSKKNASEFENSQQKIKKTTEDSTKATDNNTKATNTNTKASDTNAKANDAKTKAVEKTTKALERQRMIGEYLGQGLDKSTATSLTNFRQLKAGAIDTNTMFTLLGNNSALNTANRQAKAVNDSLVRMRMNLDFVGKGFSASEQAQLRQMKLNGATNAQLEEAIRLLKQKKQAEVLADYKNQKPALQREWLAAYDKEIAARVAKQQEAIDKVKNIVSGFEAKSRQSFGGGILDTVDRQNKALSDMAKYYSNIERLQNKAEQAEKAAQERVTKNAEKERQKQLAAAERARQAELRGQSGTSTGRDVIGQIKGIAAYALLSTAIYGAMTATFNLIGATIKMADEYTSTQQRLKLYIKDAQTLGEVNTFLAKTAIQNNVGLRENAALYAKLSPAMQRIGANTAATNQVVDAFGKSLRIGGATAMEAASATIQFAQAMASGKLAGDEFRAISEASPRFLKAIADGSGIAAEKLKGMASAGALTTEVIARALVREYHNLTKESESLGYTLEQGTNALKTGFMALIGEFNEGAGITKYLGALMADMGVDMINTAESAKKSGEAFKEWVGENAKTIQTVVDAIKLLAITVVSKYVASMVVAGAISLKTAYSLNVAALGATATQRAFGLAAIAAIRLGGALAALATPKNLFTLGLTVAGVAASYLLMRDNAAEATQKLVEQSKYVNITTEAYRELNEEQRLNARSSVANDINEVNKKLDEQAKAVEGVLKSYVKSRQSSILGMDNGVTDVLDKVTKGVISYDTALRLLSENKKVPRSIVEDFKKEKDIYDETAKAGVRYAEAAKIVGTSSELAGNKAQNATPSVQGFQNAVTGVGDEAVITGSKVQAFGKSMQDLVGTYTNLLKLRKATGLDETFATKALEEGQRLVSQNEYIVKANREIAKEQEKINALKQKGVDVSKRQAVLDRDIETTRKAQEKFSLTYAKQVAPLAKAAQDAQEANSEYTASLRKQSKEQEKLGKEAAKSRNEATKDLKKFNDQLLESQTYYNILKRTNDLEVARIASQKEYINIYKDNLAVATRIAAIQENTRKEESRQEYNKSLRDQITQLSVIAELTKEGADYETAKGLAAASFVNDAAGREAAEKSIMNALLGQSYALSDQVTEQETLNQYLKEGMELEEARFKVALSRIAKLSGGKNVYGEFGEDFENAMKSLRVKRATEASQLKINSLNREATLLTTSMAFSYTAASLAAAKLSASTQGLLYSQAETQLTKQNEVDLIAEQYETSLKISSLLSQDSEVMRDIKSQYPTILEADAQRLETARKLLEITEAYSAKQQEQKANPLGDFSKVDFEVFGDFGNPFKEALDGLNAYISGMATLDEKIATIRESMRQYQAESELASLSGQKDKAKEMMDLANKQLDLEKDLQKQKAETIDIAYGQGLKFAKSFFKENSKGHKVVSALEMALQAKKIAFALWEKKDTIAKYALELKGMLANAAMFVSTTATKIAAQMGFNVAQAQGAVAASANAPPPVGFASAAAMIALLAGIGIAISGGGSSGSFAPTNEGTGTVFGDSEAKSASIANSIDLLSENSDLMLPLTSAMLRSLRNIESNIGGVTNLILRQATGGGFNVQEGFKQNTAGKLVGGVGQIALGGVGAVGGALGGAFASGLLGASVGSALGIGLGVLTGGIGLLLGAGLGKLLGGLFGTKTTIKGQGLFGGAQSLGDILSGGFDLQEYADVQVKKKTLGVTTSTKNKTKFAEANKELENQFTLIFSGLYDSILSATDILGANTEEVKTKLENAIINIGKIDLKGLSGEQIQERLEAVFGAAADSLAQQGFAGLEDFQTVGEGYYETLIRVATGVEQAKYFTDRLNVTAIEYTDILNKQGDVAAEIVRQSVLLNNSTKDIKGGFYDLVNSFDGTAEELTDFVLTLRDLQDQLFMTGKNADYLTSAMILGAGGLDKLSSGFDAYFEMLSPAEQAAELTRRLTKEFAILGQELPADVKAFRDLLNDPRVIDITTEAGQKLYGQIIALAPEFNDLQDALESADSAAKEARRAVEDLVKSLRDLAEQARGARGETEQPRNLAYLRNEFESASILAMQGDTEAANRLLTLGKDLMQVSKLYASSGSEYAKDLAMIQRAATVSADIQANGLGTSSAPTLSPTTGTNTTPTVATTNTAMTTEMQTMREELNAGLFAIAKYVQNLDSRTERWDDGDRVMVGVQPENGDTPVPVKVVP